MDTGLAAYLTGWNTPEVMQKGAMSGAFFEAFAVTEIIKSYYNAGVLQLPLYFYRDKDGRGIDLMIWQNMTLYPIEIKKHSDPRSGDTQSFSVIDKALNTARGEGCVLSMYENVLPLGETDTTLPITYL